MSLPKTPSGLSRMAGKRWKHYCREYGIVDAGGLSILETGLKALDLDKKCCETVEKDGLMVKDRFGVLKPHGLLPTIRDARSQWLNALKMLNLDLEPIKSVGRPPGR